MTEKSRTSNNDFDYDSVEEASSHRGPKFKDVNYRRFNLTVKGPQFSKNKHTRSLYSNHFVRTQSAKMLKPRFFKDEVLSIMGSKTKPKYFRKNIFSARSMNQSQISSFKNKRITQSQTFKGREQTDNLNMVSGLTITEASHKKTYNQRAGEKYSHLSKDTRRHPLVCISTFNPHTLPSFRSYGIKSKASPRER